MPPKPKAAAASNKSEKSKVITKTSKSKPIGAKSTRKETPKGSHVTTVVNSNEATAEEPVMETSQSPLIPSIPSTPEQWLAMGRQMYSSSTTENQKDGERRVVVEYSTYKTPFPCRGDFGCVRWCDIDAEYALSFVFEGDFKANIRKYPEGTNSSSDVALTPVMLK